MDRHSEMSQSLIASSYLTSFFDMAKASGISEIDSPHLSELCVDIGRSFLIEQNLHTLSSRDIREDILCCLRARLNCFTDTHGRVSVASSKGAMMLLDLTAHIFSNWLSEVQEIFSRLEATLEQISSKFARGKPLTLASVCTLMPHAQLGSRAVHALNFHECAVVYKPRPANTDAIFQDIVRQVSTYTAIQLPQLVSMPMEDHSWSEFIPTLDQHLWRGSDLFFYNAGVMLFICYLLGVTDCTIKNLGLTERGPVLLDAETILHPSFSPEMVNWEQPPDSVLRCGLVQSLLRTAPNSADWAALVRGFSFVYSLAIHDAGLRDILITGIGSHGNAKSRVIFRSSTFYERTFILSFRASLRGPTEYSHALLKNVSRSIRPLDKEPGLQSLLRAEVHSLTEFNVPYFTAKTDGVDLFFEDTCVAPRAFTRSGAAEAIERLHRLNPQKMESAVDLIRLLACSARI